MRILTDIPDDDIQKLDTIAASQATSRAAVIRAAVATYLAQNADPSDWIARGAGYWAVGDAASSGRISVR